MAKRAKASKAKAAGSAATVGFEATLWAAADKLRGTMDAAEYTHVVLGLIFHKYISDSFEEMHATLLAGKRPHKGADPEDPDEYRAEHVLKEGARDLRTKVDRNAGRVKSLSPRGGRSD